MGRARPASARSTSWSTASTRWSASPVRRSRQPRKRRGKVTSVDKRNVLETSRMWREVVHRVHDEQYPDVELEDLLVDNTAMQLINRPADFDVVVTENMFGDILSDEAAQITGSLGMLASASLGDGVSLFRALRWFRPRHRGPGHRQPGSRRFSRPRCCSPTRSTWASRPPGSRTPWPAVLDEGWRTRDIADEGTPARPHPRHRRDGRQGSLPP